MATDVTIPALGESITEATVGEWLKAPGDAVAADEPIVSLETDKVAVEVPSPVAGTMGEQLAKVGETVNVGALIARIDAGVGAPAKAAAPTPAVVEEPKADAAAKAEPAQAKAAPLPLAGGEKTSRWPPRCAGWSATTTSIQRRSPEPVSTAG